MLVSESETAAWHECWRIDGFSAASCALEFPSVLLLAHGLSAHVCLLGCKKGQVDFDLARC